MASTIKRVVRDVLVDDATIRGFFSGVSTTATASLFVTPVFMELTGRYPRITYSETPGNTLPGMSSTTNIITLSIETQATGGANPHVLQELVMERIDQLFDDTNLTGVGISGTASYTFLSLRSGGTEISYDAQRKTYQRFLIYDCTCLKY